ncbi:FKBP-type peptidyl-prolyl cis-trans isomerase [Erythrobacter sp. YT30]|uniref:FKBP-type peptidyl-prolyl cis-trans isomerase n=1 Tax=Erythrobacter sp. YT30 TaxID=1735012 RepID=UPI00076DA668|nr:FKBP-type peptidyl-prolyl cis-trans isomerase [Erythrobacter sp. YT30]KWV91499.1 peptidylprolyl isomerase [Erythrobacter sp. YT30]
MRGAILPIAALLFAAPVFAQDNGAVEDAASQAPVRDGAWHSRQQLYLLGLEPQDGWYFIDGGIRWKYLTYTASPKKPSVEDTVTVHYEGRLIDGTVFDSSYERGEPATFPLSRLIKGWQLAIPQIGVGEAIEVAIPSDLAYGPVGSGPIPGGATLVFKIELLAIED